MSGHSKFANIKHKKEKNDAAKGKIFTIIGREIAVAVKEGGPDPSNNYKLAKVIEKAKANNVPNDTIERGIKKAAGDVGNVNYQYNTYEGYGINLEQVLNKLERKTKREWVILVRLHPAALKLSNLFSYGSKIINVTNYSNPMDIVVASDMLITDYSSISSDFLILNKPVFILALDLNHYQTHCRKLHPYYFSLPYPFAYSNEELLDAIENFDREKYLEKTEDYKRNFLKPFGDGHASEHVVSRIKQVIGFNGKE